MNKIKLLFLLIPSISFGQLDTLSDEFNRTCNLYNWTTVNEVEGWNASHVESVDVDISNEDQLTLMPWTTAWYANYRSNLLFKEVAGNFTFTTFVSATNRAENNIPGSLYSLAGTMVRTPKSMTNGSQDWTPGDENYVFLSLGFAATNHPTCSGCPGPHFEVKNTINSNSNLNVSSIDTAAALIRITKIENAILVLYQLPGQPFTIRQRYSRNDMPDTLQVGLVAYTDWNKVSTYTQPFHNAHTLNANLNPDPSSNPNLAFEPDILARFDYARFETPVIPQHLMGLDFANPNEVSDTEILNLLSYPSLSNDLSGWKIWKGIDSDWNNPQNWSNGTLPTPQDSILIPNCGCTEVNFPVVDNGSYAYASLKVEAGGQMTVLSGVDVSIDLVGNDCQFYNEGSIYIEGTFNILNSIGKTVVNAGLLDCTNLGNCTFID